MNQLVLLVNIIVCCVVYGWAQPQQLSAVGAVGVLETSLFYEKGLGVSLAKKINLSQVTIGGMIEARNDTHFNQSILPNHCWRGNLVVGFDSVLVGPEFGEYKSFIGVYGVHQSAHATMGIQEDISDPSYQIYDGTYRQSNLNALSLQMNIVSSQGLQWHGSGLGYFYSKNTPELPGLHKDISFGVKSGVHWQIKMYRSLSFFGAGTFDYIAEGSKKVVESIAVEGGLEKRAYPVIAEQYRIAFRTGITYYRKEVKLLSLYSGYSYGCRSGYYDSRERLHLFRLGLIMY
ncbi:MAG: hypothetical protein OCD01_11010 [Fibrobacterales bacterium]